MASATAIPAGVASARSACCQGLGSDHSDVFGRLRRALAGSQSDEEGNQGNPNQGNQNNQRNQNQESGNTSAGSGDDELVTDKPGQGLGRDR